MADTVKFVKTGALIFSWICMGLFSEVSSPTLPYLKNRVNCNYEQISRALVARAVGFLIGSLGAGVVGSKWRRLNDFWIFLALFVAGVATIAAPWCPNLPLLAAMFFFDGAGKGLLAVVTSTSVMELWQEKAAVPTHSLHFSFGIGALIAPQVARPFIPRTSHSSGPAHRTFDNETFAYGQRANSSEIDLHLTSTTPNYSVDRTDRIEIVYAIMGCVTLICAMIFLYFQLSSRRSEGKIVMKIRKESEAGACGKLCALCKEIKPPVVILMLIIFVFWCLPTGAERAYGKFLFAYAVDGPLKIASSTGTTLESVFWASFTAGRGLATAMSRWTPPHVLLAIEIVIKVVCAFLLAFFANSNHTVLFVASGLFGATVSPIFPAAMVWTNLYIEMNAVMNAFAFLSGAFGALVFSWIAGYLFTYKGPPFLMYLMLGYALSTLTIYIIMFTYLQFGKLKKREQQDKRLSDDELDHLNTNGTVS